MFFDESQLFLNIMIFVLGLCLGSFINVVALRYVRGQDWIRQPSACYACGQPLAWFQNLPVFGWVHHGGKAGCCGARLPMRYLFVELACGGIAVVSLLALGPEKALIYGIFILLNCIIFLTDLEAFIIPDFASIGGAVIGGLAVLLLPRAGIELLPTPMQALLGGLFGFGLLYSINFMYRLWRGHDGLGFGDVKLMGMYGVWLGAEAVLPILFLAALLGAVSGIVLILMQKIPYLQPDGAAQKTAPALPFGCFLVPVALIWLFYGAQMALLIIPNL